MDLYILNDDFHINILLLSTDESCRTGIHIHFMYVQIYIYSLIKNFWSLTLGFFVLVEGSRDTTGKDDQLLFFYFFCYIEII